MDTSQDLRQLDTSSTLEGHSLIEGYSQANATAQHHGAGEMPGVLQAKKHRTFGDNGYTNGECICSLSPCML
jgi:hypothetical protein